MAERAAIVTGASSGIGLAIAQTLGGEGYGLTVAARRPDKLEGAAEELRSAGLEIEAYCERRSTAIASHRLQRLTVERRIAALVVRKYAARHLLFA